MGAQRQELHARLVGLRSRAETARRAAKQPYGQSAVEKAVRRQDLPGARGFVGKRTSDWAPASSEKFKLPAPDSDDTLVALVTVWTRWADERLDEHWWRRQLELARDEQTRERAGGLDAWQVRARRSVYWQTVRNIAPEQLLDRERELAELTEFCTADDSPSYSWWRAPKWWGKTALMSWFALHPPPGVYVVPFTRPTS